MPGASGSLARAARIAQVSERPGSGWKLGAQGGSPRGGLFFFFLIRRPPFCLQEPWDSRGWRGLPGTPCQQPSASEEHLSNGGSEASSVPLPSSSPPTFFTETGR